jgi:O-antigen ligase
MFTRNVLINTFIFIFCFATFLGYAAYFLYISSGVYLPVLLGCALLMCFCLNVSLVRFNTLNLAYILILSAILYVGVAQSHARQYGMTKLTLTTVWMVVSACSVPLIYRKFDAFLKYSIFLGLVFVALLIMQFGHPLTYLKTTLSNGSRLSNNGPDDVASLNPIWAARYLSFILLAAAFYYQYVLSEGISLFKRVICYGIFALLAIYILACASKGPIVAGGVAYLYFMYKTGKGALILKRLLVFALVGSIGGFLLLSYVGDKGAAYLGDRFNLKGGTTYERLAFQDKIFNQMDVSSFMFGTGTGNGGYLLNGYDERAYPHNIFFELFYENGLLGILLLVFLMVRVYIISKAANRPFPVVIISFFLFYFMNSLFSGDLSANHHLFMFYFLAEYHFHVVTATHAKTNDNGTRWLLS